MWATRVRQLWPPVGNGVRQWKFDFRGCATCAARLDFVVHTKIVILADAGPPPFLWQYISAIRSIDSEGVLNEAHCGNNCRPELVCRRSSYFLQQVRGSRNGAT